MNKKEIIEFLKENNLKEVQEIKYKEDAAVVRFFYDFDDDELEAAKAYANDECEEEKEGETWFEEFFLPYLNDVAVDNAGDIIEESMETYDISAQYVSYDLEADGYDYSEFLVVFTEKDSDIEIEDVLEELDL